jgi:hypothetical protein
MTDPRPIESLLTEIEAALEARLPPGWGFTLVLYQREARVLRVGPRDNLIDVVLGAPKLGTDTEEVLALWQNLDGPRKAAMLLLMQQAGDAPPP